MTSNLRTVFGDIMTRLDMVVFERLPEGDFARIGPDQPPAWFSRVWLDVARGQAVTIVQVFPFLDRFLSEAEEFWHERGTGRLRSDPFAITDPSGGELTLAASAIVIDERRFLIIELPAGAEDQQRTLQRAREQALAHEAHLRRTAALIGPVVAAQQLTQQLAAAALTPEQQHHVGAIQEQLANLAASIETLAPVPKGVSRRTMR